MLENSHEVSPGPGLTSQRAHYPFAVWDASFCYSKILVQPLRNSVDGCAYVYVHMWAYAPIYVIPRLKLVTVRGKFICWAGE